MRGRSRDGHLRFGDSATLKTGGDRMIRDRDLWLTDGFVAGPCFGELQCSAIVAEF